MNINAKEILERKFLKNVNILIRAHTNLDFLFRFDNLFTFFSGYWVFLGTQDNAACVEHDMR